MKYLLISLLFLPSFAFAKVPSIEFVPNDQLAAICHKQVPEGSSIYGCFWGSMRRIFVAENQDEQDKEFVIHHEIGHYLLECADLSRFKGLGSTFNSTWNDPKEAAADLYALYKMNLQTTSPDNRAFFKKADNGKFVCH